MVRRVQPNYLQAHPNYEMRAIVWVMSFMKGGLMPFAILYQRWECPVVVDLVLGLLGYFVYPAGCHGDPKLIVFLA